MAEKKDKLISPYYIEFKKYCEQVTKHMTDDAQTGDVTYHQAEEFVDEQVKHVPLTGKYYSSFIGLVNDGVNQLKHEANRQKVRHDDGSKEDRK